MIKLKHFFHIEGSDSERKTTQAFLAEVEAFINDNKINPVEINHAFSTAPHRCLSVFISYIEMGDDLQKAITEGAESALGPKKGTEAEATVPEGHKGNTGVEVKGAKEASQSPVKSKPKGRNQ